MTEETSGTSNSPANPQASASSAPVESVGRNEPCPCGSGKKYKRCHGVDAAPKLTAPAEGAKPASPFPGFDPSAMDPAMMNQITQSLQRLPRAQLIKLQNMVQRAMRGEDVSKESAELQKMLPPEFAAMAQVWGSQMMGQMGGAAGAAQDMSADDAKRIVAEAVASGKMTEEQAKELLGGENPADVLAAAKKEEGGFSKLWSKIKGK